MPRKGFRRQRGIRVRREDTPTPSVEPSAEPSESVEPSAEPSESVEPTAEPSEAVTYTVTYAVAEGTELPEGATLPEAETVTATTDEETGVTSATVTVADLAVDGYTYTVAVKDADGKELTAVDGAYTITSDITVTVTYTKIVTEVTVVYVPGEGTGTEYTDPNGPFTLKKNSETGAMEYEYTVLSTSRTAFKAWKNGTKTLVGWTLDPDAETVAVIDEPITLDDTADTVTLTAVWSADSVAITYDLESNLPSDFESTITLSANTTVTASESAQPGVAFTVAGAPVQKDANGKTTESALYSFLGWSSDPAATTADYKAGSKTATLTTADSASSTLTLYPVWELQQITITFELETIPGGVKESQITAPKTLTVKKASFGGVAFKTDAALSSDDVTTMQKVGYKLIGWTSHEISEETGEETFYAVGDAAKATQALDAVDQQYATLTLYPVWEASTLTITWDINLPDGVAKAMQSNATLTVPAAAAVDTSAVSLPDKDNAITSVGGDYWKVVGWSTDAAYDVTEALGEDYVKADDTRSFYESLTEKTTALTSDDINSAVDGALTLYAVWSVDKIDVSWDANDTNSTVEIAGGTIGLSAGGSTVNIAGAPTDVTDRLFLGWSSDKDATEATYTGTSALPLNNADRIKVIQSGKPEITLYAVYMAAEKTVTLTVDGSGLYTVQSATYGPEGSAKNATTTDTTVVVPQYATNVVITLTKAADSTTVEGLDGTAQNWSISADATTSGITGDKNKTSATVSTSGSTTLTISAAVQKDDTFTLPLTLSTNAKASVTFADKTVKEYTSFTNAVTAANAETGSITITLLADTTIDGTTVKSTALGSDVTIDLGGKNLTVNAGCTLYVGSIVDTGTGSSAKVSGTMTTSDATNADKNYSGRVYTCSKIDSGLYTKADVQTWSNGAKSGNPGFVEVYQAGIGGSTNWNYLYVWGYNGSDWSGETDLVGDNAVEPYKTVAEEYAANSTAAKKVADSIIFVVSSGKYGDDEKPLVEAFGAVPEGYTFKKTDDSVGYLKTLDQATSLLETYNSSMFTILIYRFGNNDTALNVLGDCGSGETPEDPFPVKNDQGNTTHYLDASWLDLGTAAEMSEPNLGEGAGA